MIVFNYLIEHWFSVLETIAVVFGLLSVWYARKEKIAVYPTGIISVLLYVYIFIAAKVYADAAINFFYFTMSVYGWYKWTHVGGEAKTREVSRTNPNEKIIYSVIFLVALALLYLFLKSFTDSNVPILDSLVSSLSIVAMLQMAMKKLENWTMWIIADLVSIPLFIYKELYITAFQYLVFLVLAIAGYLSWRNALKSRLTNITDI